MGVLLKCTQGRISKLETGKDNDLRLKDLADYARAANVSLSVTIGPRNCAEAIKYHLFAVKHLIDKLVGLDDGRDSKLTEGLLEFLDKFALVHGRTGWKLKTSTQGRLMLARVNRRKSKSFRARIL